MNDREFLTLQISLLRLFAKIIFSREFPNLQYTLLIIGFVMIKLWNNPQMEVLGQVVIPVEATQNVSFYGMVPVDNSS